MNQQSQNGREALRDQDLRVWTAEDPGSGAKYVGVFNISDSDRTVELPWAKLGLVWSAPAVRDLWLHRELGRMPSIKVVLRPHASILYKVSP